MKRIISVAALIFAFTIANAQPIKDYYIPKSPNNKAIFYMLNEDGSKLTDFKTWLYYALEENSNVVTKGSLFRGHVVSATVRWVVFTNNEVKMIKSYISNEMTGQKSEQSYATPLVILKMPPISGEISWTYVDVSGDKLTCTASWTKVTIGKNQKKAIKVVKAKEHTKLKEIEYYVQDIGLWQTDLQMSDGTRCTFEEMETIEYDPDFMK